MKIGGLQRSSMIDFPGYLSCVIFTRGCDLDCFYCHNRQMLADGDVTSEAEVFEFLQRRVGLLDGVVISGGEPALQKDLRRFVSQVKQMGFKIKLDTNGQHDGVVQGLLDILDYVAVDIKCLPEDAQEVCGNRWAFARSERMVEILLRQRMEFEVRTTLYPGMTFPKLCTLLSRLSEMPRYRLNFFQMPREYKLQDGDRLMRPILSELEVRSKLMELKKFQPNLVI